MTADELTVLLPVGPDPAMKSLSEPLQGLPGGGGPLRVNTPDNDPDQHFLIDLVVEPGTTPINVLAGPAIVTHARFTQSNPYYLNAGLYVVTGTSCGTPPEPPGPLLQLNNEAPLAAPSGARLCLVPPEEAVEPPIRAWLQGYRSYQ